MIIALSQKSQEKNWKENLLVFKELPKNRQPFQFQYKKKLEKLIKTDKKSQKLYLTDYNLLIVQDLWQVHYQILLIILLKEFIKLNVNTDTLIKNVKLAKSNTKITKTVLNTKALKMIYQNTNV